MCFFFKKKKENWKYVYEEYTDKFLGEDVPRRSLRFRVNMDNGKVEELVELGYPIPPGWVELPLEHTKILMSKIEDRGDYFALVSEDTKGLTPIKRNIVKIE